MIVLSRIPSRAVRRVGTVAAVGIFDGVHRGHQKILARAVTRARATRTTPAAVTFHPHPVSVLRPGAALPLLIGLEERLRRVAAAGIRLALVVRFTRPFSRWSPEEFVRRVLAEGLRAREVVVGHDFGFGAGRSGSTATLRALGRRYGFRTHVVPPVRLGRARVSSGRIRRLIAEGRLAAAERLLGRPVSVTGGVVRGACRGRALGFPTANLRIESGVLPPVGVYAVHAKLSSSRTRGGQAFRGNDTFLGMANIGFRPTFRSGGVRPLLDKRGLTPLLEVHLFGMRRPLYHRTLQVEFRKRLRPERRFPSAEALAAQLACDARRARRVFALQGKGRMI